MLTATSRVTIMANTTGVILQIFLASIDYDSFLFSFYIIENLDKDLTET